MGHWTQVLSGFVSQAFASEASRLSPPWCPIAMEMAPLSFGPRALSSSFQISHLPIYFALATSVTLPSKANAIYNALKHSLGQIIGRLCQTKPQATPLLITPPEACSLEPTEARRDHIS